ncbi:MAG: hypothetical protein U1C74_17275 [Phenylobacterium sp.]|nr:hypothetical protein [Phenylobacterium sp.]
MMLRLTPQEPIMSKSISKQVRHDIEETLEDIGKALQKAGEALSDDAEAAVADAARVLREAATRLAEFTPPEARHVAQKAVSEVKEHPIATAAAALSAAAALIALLRMGRKTQA